MEECNWTEIGLKSTMRRGKRAWMMSEEERKNLDTEKRQLVHTRHMPHTHMPHTYRQSVSILLDINRRQPFASQRNQMTSSGNIVLLQHGINFGSIPQGSLQKNIIDTKRLTQSNIILDLMQRKTRAEECNEAINNWPGWNRNIIIQHNMIIKDNHWDFTISANSIHNLFRQRTNIKNKAKKWSRKRVKWKRTCTSPDRERMQQRGREQTSIIAADLNFFFIAQIPSLHFRSLRSEGSAWLIEDIDVAKTAPEILPDAKSTDWWSPVQIFSDCCLERKNSAPLCWSDFSLFGYLCFKLSFAMSSSSTFSLLPKEIVVKILSFCNIHDFGRLVFVDHFFEASVQTAWSRITSLHTTGQRFRQGLSRIIQERCGPALKKIVITGSSTSAPEISAALSCFSLTALEELSLTDNAWQRNPEIPSFIAALPSPFTVFFVASFMPYHIGWHDEFNPDSVTVRSS